MKNGAPPRWGRIGILNTIEHALTRFSDSATTLLLLWGLNPELFGSLALAQAFAAPLLLLCVAPENVLYRDFPRLRENRDALSGKIRAFRRFGWWKFAALLQISVILVFSGVFPEGEGSRIDRFAAFLWAILLSLAPQVSGADRAFLRLDLKLRELNAVTLLQKASLLGGTGAVLVFFPGNLWALVSVAAFALFSSAFLAWRYARRHLPEAAGSRVRTFRETAESLRDFSIWSHFSGVVLGWVQTMDLYFLGSFGISARTAGLYAASLKLANLSYAVPSALVNLFGVWLGQQDTSTLEGTEKARKRALTRTGGLLGILATQGLVLWALSPFIFRIFSRGRWSDVEIRSMQEWLGWMLLGSLPIAGGFLLDFWLLVKTRARDCALSIYLPWLIGSAVVYSSAAAFGGPLAAAKANVAAGALFGFLLLWRWRRCAG